MMIIPQDRDRKMVLGSLKSIIDNYTQKSSLKTKDSLKQQGQLQSLLKNIRMHKLRQVFIQKLTRNNTFQTPVKFDIVSQKQRNQRRFFKIKGINLDQHIVSLIYILDIVFVLITFVIGSFLAFLDDFRTSQDGPSILVDVLMIIAVIATSLKISISSMTVTIQDGILLVYLTDILSNYFSTFQVLIDLAHLFNIVASLVFQNNVVWLGVSLFCVSLFKLFTLYQNLRIVETTFINSFRKEQYWNLIQVALFNIFFAHFLSAILLAMAKLNQQQNWMVANQIHLERWYVQWVWTYYWACTIMMTVGFGDFLPLTFRQAAIVATIQLFSCIVLAYNISSIGNIISAIRGAQIQTKRKISIFKRMAMQNNIDVGLQRRIQGYLKQQTAIIEQFEFKQQAALLEQLPQNLKQQYIIQANKNIFPDLPFFKNLQKKTLVNLSQSFKGEIFYPGEYMTKLNEVNRNIMILKQGKVGLAYKKYGSHLNGTIVQTIQIQKHKTTDSIGQQTIKSIPFLLNTDFLSRTKQINYDIVAQSYAFVFLINNDDFNSIIKSSQIDSSYYYSIQHKHTISIHQWQQLQCQLCSIKNYQKQQDNIIKYHTKFQCPKLHFLPVQGIIIMKQIKSKGTQQNRQQIYQRNKHKQSNPLNLRKKLFKPYEKARNLTFSQKLTIEIKDEFVKKILQSLIIRYNNDIQSKGFMSRQLNSQNSLSSYKNIIKKQQQQQQKTLKIQKIVKQTIQQTVTGYRSQFWGLQIDIMYDYVNYFTQQNVKNLDLVSLKNGKLSKNNILTQKKKFKTIIQPFQTNDYFAPQSSKELLNRH